MKAIAVFVLLLLFLAPPVISQVPDNKLIVPGQRVGAWTLQMTIEEIAGALGRQKQIIRTGYVQGSVDVQGDLRDYRWELVGWLDAWTRDGRSILLLDVWGSPEFVTEKGVKSGVPRADVEIAYGPPTRVTHRSTEGADTLWYSEIGLCVGFTPTGVGYTPIGIVMFIGVFRPGSASSIWKR